MNAPVLKSPFFAVSAAPRVSARSKSRPVGSATPKGTVVRAVKKQSPAKSYLSHAHPVSWKTSIENNEAHVIWRALQRLVSSHPLVRSTLAAPQSAFNSANSLSIGDLTQDLYLLLLQKRRFDHYLVSQMTDAEIEREIYQIELTNLLIGNLRRRRPENYRIVRRVSGVLECDLHFRQYRRAGGRLANQPARYRQAAEAVYGLRGWADDKPIKDSGTFTDLIANIPMRMRNRRKTGCTGETQVIVSNQELTELMVEILETIDSPAPLRILRQLALARLPVCDPEMASIDEDTDESGRRNPGDWLVSTDASPEQMALRSEQEAEARQAAVAFLDRLRALTRSNPQRTERLWRVLWHCYFDAEEPSQLEIAEMVGISDSSVSDYRRKIETEMRKLDFAQDQLRAFAEELSEQLRWRLFVPLNGDDSSEAQPALWAQPDLLALMPMSTRAKARSAALPA